jgi:hypothetical protein
MTKIKQRGRASSICVVLALACFAAEHVRGNMVWDAFGGGFLGIAIGVLLTSEPVWQTYRAGIAMLFRR